MFKKPFVTTTAVGAGVLIVAAAGLIGYDAYQTGKEVANDLIDSRKDNKQLMKELAELRDRMRSQPSTSVTPVQPQQQVA